MNIFWNETRSNIVTASLSSIVSVEKLIFIQLYIASIVLLKQLLSVRILDFLKFCVL